MVSLRNLLSLCVLESNPDTVLSGSEGLNS